MPRGGKRLGSGRPIGSRNKAIVALEAALRSASENPIDVAGAPEERGLRVLGALASIAADARYPAPVRIKAADIALPFLLPHAPHQVGAVLP